VAQVTLTLPSLHGHDRHQQHDLRNVVQQRLCGAGDRDLERRRLDVPDPRPRRRQQPVGHDDGPGCLRLVLDPHAHERGRLHLTFLNRKGSFSQYYDA